MGLVTGTVWSHGARMIEGGSTACTLSNEARQTRNLGKKNMQFENIHMANMAKKQSKQNMQAVSTNVHVHKIQYPSTHFNIPKQSSTISASCSYTTAIPSFTTSRTWHTCMQVMVIKHNILLIVKHACTKLLSKDI